MNNSAIRDNEDKSSGMSIVGADTNQISQFTHQIYVDTRDCISQQSLQDAVTVFRLQGGREAASGSIVSTTGAGVSPIVVTFDSVANLRDNDTIVIRGIMGNTNANGIKTILNVNTGANTAELSNNIGNGAYNGGGTWTRPADTGIPSINESTCYIENNTLKFTLTKPLKNIRKISLDQITIPRDIIPIEEYLGDLVEISILLTGVTNFTSVESRWDTFIPQEAKYMKSRMLGFYSTPLDIFRSYNNGAFSPANSVTPPPLTLWNPPIGSWPLQPEPYPFQTVPTYKSNDFIVTGHTGPYYLVLSGYGVYDLIDWTSNTGVPVTDAAITSIVRKLLLLLITPKQSYRDIDYIELILNSNTVTPGDLVSPFGYGDFQRFVPGPGIQQNYQPGTSDGADPRIVGPTWPVPFPNFNGNVFGPYDAPGDRFQRTGIRDTIQDLFLNGDLNNLQGDPIIKPYIPTEDLMSDSIFGLNFSGLVEVNLDNVGTTNNYNILNAMRMLPNGFGALTIRARGDGIANYTNIYQFAGGQGPSPLGIPPTGGAWVNNDVYGGGGSMQFPIASGPFSGNLTPSGSDPLSPGDGTGIPIQHRNSWSDRGTENGAFLSRLSNYVLYVINAAPDTDFVMHIEQADRNIRVQSTNEEIPAAMCTIPIRLSPGSTNGTQKFQEALFSLMSYSGFWNRRFINPEAGLYQLNCSFRTREGTPILLNKMLQERRSLQFLNLFNGILNSSDILADIANINFFFLFDPLNPTLSKRMKTYLSFKLNVECYQHINIGMFPDRIGPGRLDVLKPNNNDGPDSNVGNKQIESNGYMNYT